MAANEKTQAKTDQAKGPVPQTPPGRHPAAADPLRGDVPPTHALAQHVNDAPQSSSVIHRQPPGMSMPSRRSLRK